MLLPVWRALVVLEAVVDVTTTFVTVTFSVVVIAAVAII